jgi:SAM-dependent methyltransferase
MNHFQSGMIRATAEVFDLPGPVLEVGSYQVAGQEGICDLRHLFPDRAYIGLDCRPGPGVTVVGNVENLPQADGTVGTVIAMNTFEHVRRFWRGLEEVHRVLRPDGALLLACPFYFKIHNYPADYWRFTPRAFELLLEDYPSKIIGWQGPAHRPAHVWALAFREGRRPIQPEEHEHYQRLIRQYARHPLPLAKQLRYRLGSWLFGRRPFAPYLEQMQWESICLNSTPSPSAQGRPRPATALLVD